MFKSILLLVATVFGLLLGSVLYASPIAAQTSAIAFDEDVHNPTLDSSQTACWTEHALLSNVDYLIDFDEKTKHLIANQPGFYQLEPQAVAVAAGTYTVTLVSWDDWATYPEPRTLPEDDQTREQYFVQFLDADGDVIAETAPIGDLSNQFSRRIEQLASAVVLDRPAAFVVARHPFAPLTGADEYESIHPVCMGLNVADVVGLLGEIGDFVWEDKNHNSRQDPGEKGLPNIPVKLYRQVENGDLEWVERQFTDAYGHYLFDELEAGDYVVEFSPVMFVGESAEGQLSYKMKPCQCHAAENEARDSDAEANYRTLPIYLEAGEVDMEWDAGFHYPHVKIGDTVWHDANANGEQEAGESGLAGVAVTLYRDKLKIAEIVTDASGKYPFSGLKEDKGFPNWLHLEYGTYWLHFAAPDGYRRSPAHQFGNDELDSDPVGNGRTELTQLDPGEEDLSWDAGFYLPASVGDFVWNDENMNGLQDGGEPGLANVKVSLVREGIVTAETQTTADGFYRFDGLEPAVYRLIFEPPADFVASPHDQGSDDLMDSDIGVRGRTAEFTLTSGQIDLSRDAGFYLPLGTIGDRVWHDRNQNGVQDVGEEGLAGVGVALFRADGTEVARVETQAIEPDGTGIYYLFENVPAGDYYVQFEKPVGMDKVSPADVGDDGLDSDVIDATALRSAEFTLSPGEINRTIDAGFYRNMPDPACTRIDLENGRQGSSGAGVAGTYIVQKPGGGFVVDWHAGPTEVDSGWIKNIHISPSQILVEVKFVPDTGGDGTFLEILNPAPGETYGWMARGMCHALEVQFPSSWPYSVRPVTDLVTGRVK